MISILIPCYNAKEWIGEAIESALSQDYRDKEVVVLDDGSTDESLSIIQSFGDHVRWETGPNRGGGKARNRLLEMARGDWIQYLDADDYLKPGKLQANMKTIQATPNIDILFGPVEVEFFNSGVLHARTVVHGDAFQSNADPWRMLALWQLPQTGGPLWRRRALLDVHGWREDQPCCQEHELYLRLLVAQKVVYFTKIVGAVYRRFETGTLSTRDMPLVRRERLKIEARLEAHLEATCALTPERQWAINQARFELARSAWPEDRAEARAIAATIRGAGQGFRPDGPAAPPTYRFLYRTFGFEVAERAASMKRRFLSIGAK